MEAEVIGWKFFTGDIDGKHIDSGRVYIVMPVDESRGNSKGLSGVEVRVPNSDAIKRISHLPVPFRAELEMETVAAGGGTFKQVCREVRPVALAAARPAPAKAA